MARLFNLLFSCVAMLLFVLSTIGCTILLFVASKNQRKKIPTLWAKSFIFLFRIRLRVDGLENIPPQGSLYIYNHSSNADPFAVLAAVPRNLRMGAKKELSKVPMLGKGMSLGGTVWIDRSNREAVLQSYRAIYGEVRGGDNFVLAPEGTRQSKEFPLGEFKMGPFIFATEAKVPLVAVVLKGSFSLWPRSHLFPQLGHVIAVKICPPLVTEGTSVEELKIKAKATMEEAYRKL